MTCNFVPAINNLRLRSASRSRRPVGFVSGGWVDILADATVRPSREWLMLATQNWETAAALKRNWAFSSCNVLHLDKGQWCSIRSLLQSLSCIKIWPNRIPRGGSPLLTALHFNITVLPFNSTAPAFAAFVPFLKIYLYWSGNLQIYYFICCSHTLDNGNVQILGQWKCSWLVFTTAEDEGPCNSKALALVTLAFCSSRTLNHGRGAGLSGSLLAKVWLTSWRWPRPGPCRVWWVMQGTSAV